MVREELLRNFLGAALVSAGGEVPLDHLESLLQEKFAIELPADANHGMLEKYLVTHFADICRVKKATDGHFVVRVLKLQSIANLLPAGYDEPEFEPLQTPESSLPLGTQMTEKPAENIPNLTQTAQDKADRSAMKSPGVVKAPSVQPRPKFNSVFDRVGHQDERDAAVELANLENQLSEECSVRGIIEPTFKSTISGGNRKEAFCVATWGNEKIQSYPGVFATQVGAKAHVIKKIIAQMDELVEKISSCHSSLGAEDETTRDPPLGECSDGNSIYGNGDEAEIIPESKTERDICDNGTATDLEPDSATLDTEFHVVPRDDQVANEENFPECADADLSVSSVPEAQSNPDISWKQTAAGATLASTHPIIDLEPNIDMEKPVSLGYLSCVLSDGAFMVQVKGPGLDKWEQQTLVFDPRSPAPQITPFRWFAVHVKEGTEIDFYDRAMCMSEGDPCYDERGFVKFYFPDNGYEEFIDPSMIFELGNYDDINRLPVQGVRIHAVGLTGNTPVEELNVTHPPHHELLFIPADRAACFMANCSEDVPHVYIYNTVIKRVLC